MKHHQESKPTSNSADFIEDGFDFRQGPGQGKPPVRKARKASKSDKIISWFLTIAIIVISLIIVYQVYTLAVYYYDLYRNGKAIETAQNIFNSIPDTTPAPTAAASSEPEAPSAPETALVKEMNPKISQLREELNNDDIVGYIVIKDTTINFPIVQAEDNTFYLTKNIMKENNSSGALFLDYMNSPDFTDQNSVVYGHNMRNRTMFHDLRYYYLEPDFFTDHPEIIVTTLYDETVWQIFSAYRTSTSFDYIQVTFNSASPFLPFLKQIYEKSEIKTNVTVGEDDIILTLSTCTNTAANMRCAVHAKLIERR